MEALHSLGPCQPGWLAGQAEPATPGTGKGLNHAKFSLPGPLPKLFLSSIKERGVAAVSDGAGAVSAPSPSSEGASARDLVCRRQTGVAAGALSSHRAAEVPELDGPSSPSSVQESKRKQLAEQHNQSEQRRRRKINAKLDELQAMVPFSRSREKAAILLDVIEYIKSLQAQLQIMSAITACDYATHGACPAPMDSFLPADMRLGASPSTLHTPVPPTPIFSPFVLSPGEPGPGFGPAGTGMEQYGLPMGRGKRSRSGGVNCDTGWDGWSYSSGESSEPLRAIIDTTTICYGRPIGARNGPLLWGGSAKHS